MRWQLLIGTMPWLWGDTLSRIGEPAVPVLVEALSDKLNEDFREYAARALNLMGVAAIPAMPALIQALSDPSDEVRSYAAYTFAKLEGAASDAVPALIKALDDEDEEVRNHVVFALEKLEPRKRNKHLKR